MKIEVPQSLIIEIHRLAAGGVLHLPAGQERPGKYVVRTEYGTYELVGKPDEDYCDEVMLKTHVYRK